MKNLMLVLFVFCVIRAQGQIVVSFAGKPNGSYINLEELLNEKQLIVKNNEATVFRFTVSTNIKGFTLEELSQSYFIRESQRRLFKACLPGERIYFENIEAFMPDGSIVKLPDYVLVKDGPVASILRRPDHDDYASVNYLIKTKRIYAYPNHVSYDTSIIKVVSFRIVSVQPDYYYIYESKSNMLTSEMIDFAKGAVTDFYISNIKAEDTAQNQLTLRSFRIYTQADCIFRSKNQLLNSSKLDLISPTSGLKVKSFRIMKTGDFEKEADSYIESSNEDYTKEMKDYISKCNLGDTITFSVNCNDPLADNCHEMLVKIVE